jgi:hypothetical protein
VSTTIASFWIAFARLAMSSAAAVLPARIAIDTSP